MTENLTALKLQCIGERGRGRGRRRGEERRGERKGKEEKKGRGGGGEGGGWMEGVLIHKLQQLPRTETEHVYSIKCLLYSSARV